MKPPFPLPVKVKPHPVMNGEFEIHAPCVGVIAVVYGELEAQWIAECLNTKRIEVTE